MTNFKKTNVFKLPNESSSFFHLTQLKSITLIDDESESENDSNVDWTIESSISEEKDKDKSVKNNKNDENDSDDSDEFDLKNILADQNKTVCVSDPEINYEIVKDNKNKNSVKIIINLDLDSDSNNSIIIDFTINKKMFLKMAKELKIK